MTNIKILKDWWCCLQVPWTKSFLNQKKTD